MAIHTKASMTIVGPAITTGLSERKPSQLNILQMASGKTLPPLEEELVEMALGQNALQI
jgi:hypothetical protein